MNKTYNFIMSEWLCHPDCSLYALVDGLQYERHFGYEITAEKGISYPLFDMYPDSKIAFAGPWLLRLNTSVFYRDALNELDVEYPAVSWLLSPLPPISLIHRFKEFLYLELPNGKCALFRFYDPRVMERLHFWLEDSDCIKLVEDVTKWVLTTHDKVFDFKAQVDSRRFD